jgi:hypothetical protein
MSQQYVGIDLHRRRSVIVRMTPEGEVIEQVRIDNDPVALSLEIAKAGTNPEVVLEATYGWYWAADVLKDAGAEVHLAHPLGINGFKNRRVKRDGVDAYDLADLLRMNRLPEGWIAAHHIRELRELVRYRAKLVALGPARSHRSTRSSPSMASRSQSPTSSVSTATASSTTSAWSAPMRSGSHRCAS